MVLLDSIPVFIVVTIASVMLLVGVAFKKRGVSLASIPLIFIATVLGIVVVFEHTYVAKWGYVAIAASIAWLCVFISMAIIHERNQKPIDVPDKAE